MKTTNKNILLELLRLLYIKVVVFIGGTEMEWNQSCIWKFCFVNKVKVNKEYKKTFEFSLTNNTHLK